MTLLDHPDADGSPARPSRDARRPVAALVIVLALFAVGCAGEADAPTAAPDTGVTGTGDTGATSTCAPDLGTSATRGSHERVDVSVDGTDRWYTRYVPASYDGEPVPLVVDLHGYLSGSAGESIMSDFGAVADDEGFVVATPQGNSDKPYWNAVPHADLPDDVGFVEAVIDDVEAQVCIDPTRVHVVGFSNGAFLASLIACRLPDRVASVAPVAGLLLPADCSPSRPIPILSIHGTADRFVSFAGPPNPALADLDWNDESRRAFDGLPFAPVTDTAARWAALDGCGDEPTRTAIGTSVELIDYEGCTDSSAVSLYVVDGGGHTWPSSEFSAASEGILGKTTTEIDASRVIWDFFEDPPLP